MHENLLSPTNITLFGRVFPLAVAGIPATLGANHFLRDQLQADGAQFARIYAISYEGTFHHLSRPAIFLVHGTGTEIRGAGLEPRGTKAGGMTDDSGLIAKGFQFERSAEGAPKPIGPGQSVRFWEYDKGDFTLRLDIASGTFEDVLLDAEVDAQLEITSAAKGKISHAAKMNIAHRNG